MPTVLVGPINLTTLAGSERPDAMSEIKNSLKALMGLSPRLNVVTDGAAQVVREVEKCLEELQITVPGEVLVSGDGSQDTWLAFRRIGGRIGDRFRIAIVRTTVATDDHESKDVEVVPWLEASRDMKVHTFPKLPTLLEVIVANVRKSISAMEEKRPELEAILAEMKE